VHFGYTIVYVPDVEAAVTFYESAFGFRRRFNSDDWDYAELETGDTTLSFAHNRMAESLGLTITPNAPERPAAGIELAFVTEDVEAGFRKATEAGATPVTDPHQTPWGQTVSYVRDLNGVLVEICSPVSS
jgi:lactoylglutathione lyase